MVIRQPAHTLRAFHLRAFTLIELLVVIAIIAILAALLFPAFAAAREQAHQSNTISSLHDTYVGVKLYDADEGHFPYSLFPYAETPLTPIPTAPPYNRPAVTGDLGKNPIVSMSQATGYFTTSILNAPERGYLYHEQIKDYITFTNLDNFRKTQQDVTTAYWPLNSPISIANGGTAAHPIQVVWTAAGNAVHCPSSGDPDIPSNGVVATYAGQPKLYYVEDSMDIGPMLDNNGDIIYQGNTSTPLYELHYSTDWSHLYGVGCDVYSANPTQPIVSQLKYANPPTDSTIITYVTQHVASAGSSKVIVLTLNGNARKVDAKVAAQSLPVNYVGP